MTREIGYMRNPRRLSLLSGSAEAVRTLRKAGFLVVMVTNQSGVGRGFFPKSRVAETHRRLKALLRRQGARLDAIYVCPHAPGEGCDCRKPKTKLVRQAALRFRIDLRQSFVVGDKGTDVKLAKAARCQGVLVRTGYGRRELRKLHRSGGPHPDFVARNLRSAARWILSGALRG